MSSGIRSKFPSRLQLSSLPWLNHLLSPLNINLVSFRGTRLSHSPLFITHLLAHHKILLQSLLGHMDFHPSNQQTTIQIPNLKLASGKHRHPPNIHLLPDTLEPRLLLGFISCFASALDDLFPYHALPPLPVTACIVLDTPSKLFVRANHCLNCDWNDFRMGYDFPKR